MSPQSPLMCPLLPLHPLPRITAELPGAGGVIKTELQDFDVEEVPAYEPCGEGQHLYLWIEKRDVSGPFLRRHLSRTLDVAAREIGMAGMKDRRAVTRQWVSVPDTCEPRLDAAADDKVAVLKVVRHRNKLRTGHLQGNRFAIRVRDALPDGLRLMQDKLTMLSERGMPNFYGSQRMGHGGSTLAAGWALSVGRDGQVRVEMSDGTEHRANLRDRQLRRLAASALQSELFNRIVARRLADGTIANVQAGDVCRKRDSGGVFVAEDAAREQARLDAGELVITGPMWGPKMRRPTDAAEALEREELAAAGLTEASFAAIGSLAEGTRRSLLVWPRDVSVQADDAGIVVRFFLPSGSFATVLLHEIAGPAGAGDATTGAPSCD